MYEKKTGNIAADLTQEPMPPVRSGHGQFTLDPKVVAAREVALLQLDSDNLLGKRSLVLARLLVVLDERLRAGEPVCLYECGARQDGFCSGACYSGEIARFMAQNASRLGLSYRGFEPTFQVERLRQEIEGQRALSCCGDELTKLIERDAICDYQRLRNEVETDAAAGKQVVIFSSHVLSDPALRVDLPFWTLPGLHVHSVLAEELCQYRLRVFFKDRYEAAWDRNIEHAKKRGEDMWRYDIELDPYIWEGLWRESFKLDPLEHVRFFSEALGLGPVQFCDSTDWVLLYTWDRRERAPDLHQ